MGRLVDMPLRFRFKRLLVALVHLLQRSVVPSSIGHVERSLPARAGRPTTPCPPRHRIPPPVILHMGAPQKLLLRGSGLATRRPTRGPINATGEQVALFRTSGKRSARGLRLTS